MCLIVLAWQCHPHYPLIFAGNRDEFFARPTRAAEWWPAATSVLAGYDEQGGGTWCGLTKSGRLAALTNFRAPGEHDPSAPSRGQLVGRFLCGSMPVPDYLADLAPSKALYNGFNLILADHLGVPDRRALWVDSNRDPAMPRQLQSGLYAVSNARLDTPWPKVVAAKQRLGLILEDPHLEVAALEEALLALLATADVAPDALLPDTGVSRQMERDLSPAFIRMPGYGTRASSLMIVGAEGATRFFERSFDPEGRASDRQFELILPSSLRA